MWCHIVCSHLFGVYLPALSNQAVCNVVYLRAHIYLSNGIVCAQTEVDLKPKKKRGDLRLKKEKNSIQHASFMNDSQAQQNLM